MSVALTNAMTRMKKYAGEHHLWLALIVAILAVVGLGTWGLVYRADHGLRTDLLQQTRLVAQSLDLHRVHALSGTEADLNSPDYLRLKAQLTAMRLANPRNRFLYLMGRQADGQIFFFVDAEPPGSNGYAPPGLPYEEASEELQAVFTSGQESVEGPYVDRWGVWISAFVPLSDAGPDGAQTVLGIDIDARDWKWMVAAKAALPEGLFLVLIIGALTALFAIHRSSVLPKPVLRRLWPVLAIPLLLLFAGFGGLLVKMQQERLRAISLLAAGDGHRFGSVAGGTVAHAGGDAGGLAARHGPDSGAPGGRPRGSAGYLSAPAETASSPRGGHALLFF